MKKRASLIRFNVKLLPSIPASWKEKIGLALFALIYWLAVRLGFLLAVQPDGIAPIWLASGVALAALLLFPKRQRMKLLAIIFVINTLGDWMNGNLSWISFGFAFANTLETWFCAWTLEYFCKSKITFGRAIEIIVLLGAVIFYNALTILLGAAFFYFVFNVAFINAWLAWWGADGLGMILAAPVIVTWAVGQRAPQIPSLQKFTELILLVLVLTLFASLLFGPFTRAEEPLLRNYMIFPLLIWLAFRFSPREMSNALLLFSGIAIWNTLRGYGIFGFADQSRAEHLLALQMYLGIAVFSGLLLSAIVNERKQAAKAIRASEEKYRLVADFTYDWEAWHARGAYIYVSPSCQRITGYTAAEFLADANLIVNIAHPDDREKIADHFHATTDRKQEEDIQFDFRIITKSGEMRWVNHVCTAVYGDHGEWLGRRESNRDITERKKSEAVLRSRLWLSRFADDHTIEQLLQSALNEAEALTDSQISFFHFISSDNKMLERQAWSANTLQNLCGIDHDRAHYPLDNAGVWADCVYKREAVMYNDYAHLERRKGLPEGHVPVARIIVVPVIRNDRIEAILGVGNKPINYDEQDVKTISQVSALVWDIVLRKRSEDELRNTKDKLAAANDELKIALGREIKLAHTDFLTEINNRRYLFELAASALNFAVRYQMPLSAILFDIDHFKKVNDIYGHHIGDLVLQRVVKAACAELRSSDMIGRYGGEEFVIILPMTSAQQSYKLAERIRAGVEALRTPTPIGDVSVTISVGIVELLHAPRASGAEPETLDNLIRSADEAMYAAKRAGRNRIEIFERE